MNWKSISTISLLVFAIAFAVCNGNFSGQQQKDTINCNLSNTCTVAKTWVNGGQVNTQFKCVIQNNGVNPVSFIDIRISNNTAVYNLWEVISVNNGLSFDFPRWRIDSQLAAGGVHSWGYIVNSDQPLDIQVCENGPVAAIPVSKSVVSDNTNNGNVKCFVSNKCSISNEWKNDNNVQTNKQYTCKITNEGTVPLSFIDVRLSNNTALYNLWELRTINNGLSFELPSWRIDSPLLPGQSHSWGYIVDDDVALNVEVCQHGTA